MVTRLDQAAIGRRRQGNSDRPQPCALPHPRWPIAVLVRGSSRQFQVVIELCFDTINMQGSVVSSMEATVPLDNPPYTAVTTRDNFSSTFNGAVFVVKF
jgi:hypothetical protein